jgi:ribosome-binding protein aMBF1 (putative translation factor)
MTQAMKLHYVSLGIIGLCSATGVTAGSAQALTVHSAPQTKHIDAVSVDDMMSELGFTDSDLSDANKWVAETFYGDQPDSIKTLRLKAGLSQKELAAKIQSQQSYVARLERGDNSDLRLSTLTQLSAALGVSLDVLAKAIVNGASNV